MYEYVKVPRHVLNNLIGAAQHGQSALATLQKEGEQRYVPITNMLAEAVKDVESAGVLAVGKTNPIVDAFRKAKEAALNADPGPDHDGGTCNFDSPAIQIKGIRESTLKAHAQAAGIDVDSFHWFSGKKWFFVHVPVKGQASRRSVMAEAATKALKEANVEGMKVCLYAQAD